MRRAALPEIVITAALLILAAERCAAETLSPSAQRGKVFVQTNCAQCHAVGSVGGSPLALAPPFRTLHLRYPVADLQRPLADGVHPIMPKFQLNAGQVEDVMAYLRMLRR